MACLLWVGSVGAASRTALGGVLEWDLQLGRASPRLLGEAPAGGE
mgnify:CR=1 FL=1